MRQQKFNHQTETTTQDLTT